jgi:hypothetical protein
MGMGFAARYTHVSAGETDFQIENGGSVHVWGIEVSATDAGICRIEDASNNSIMVLDMAANSNFVLDVPFLADAGIQVTTGSAMTCVVFHGSSGG